MGIALFFFFTAAFGTVTCQLSFNPGGKETPQSPETVTNDTVDARLGLIAPSLGVEPIPGVSGGKGGLDEYNEKYPNTGGKNYGGNNGGGYYPPQPAGPGNYGGNNGGGNYPQQPGGPGNYGGNNGGGNYPSQPIGPGNYDGNNGGGNYPSQPTGPGNYGGNNGQLYPPRPSGPGNYGSNNGGGNYPSEPTGPGNYGGNNGQLYPPSPSGPGNNGGNHGGNYPPGQTNKCKCVPKHYCNQRPGPGPIPPGDDGYGKGNGEYVDPGLLPSNPETDGSGKIDIRIVNNPPVGLACGDGQIYCCDQGRDEGEGPYPHPPAGTCGVPSLINVPNYKPVYGQADFGEYPWFAVILSNSNNYLGAGALLDSSHVLTAAHKVKDYTGGYSMKVRLGEWNAQDDSELYKNVEIEVARVDIHPKFNAENLQNDVAIIKLAQPIDTSAYPHINSICLPNHGYNYVGRRCWVAGFGKDAFKVGKHSYHLREVDVPIVHSGDCEARLRRTRLGEYFQLNRRSFICAGGEDGKDACTGDGGSPLVCRSDRGEFQVVGLVAWGIGCADSGIPGVYVNVPSYTNWINDKLAY